MPSANAIFFSGDRVEGTGNPVIERLSDSRNIAEILVSKLGASVNAWVVEASVFNGPFAVYREFIPSVNSWGEPRSYDPNGFPASSSTFLLISKCLEEVSISACGILPFFAFKLFPLCGSSFATSICCLDGMIIVKKKKKNLPIRS